MCVVCVHTGIFLHVSCLHEDEITVSRDNMGFFYFWKKIFFDILRIFLALLDYVSRAHEIAICLSSVCPSVSQLSLNLMHSFISNFSCGFPWAIRLDLF